MSVLLAVDYFAERAFRNAYERAGFEQLAAIAEIALKDPPHWAPTAPGQTEDLEPVREWVERMAASRARITVITSQGKVLVDSQSDASTMENHGTRPEVLEAKEKGQGRSIRHSVTIKRDLLYFAVREKTAAGPPLYLRFALPVQAVDDVLSALRQKLWFASFLILLIAGGAALWFSRGFIHRIELLREFSRRVAEGDFRPIPRDGSGDALEALLLQRRELRCALALIALVRLLRQCLGTTDQVGIRTLRILRQVGVDLRSRAAVGVAPQLRDAAPGVARRVLHRGLYALHVVAPVQASALAWSMTRICLGEPVACLRTRAIMS